MVDTPSAKESRLNPFLFPTDTDLRFVLLIVAVLGASLFIYAALFFSLNSAQYQGAILQCLHAAGPPPDTSSATGDLLAQIPQRMLPGKAADACMEPQEQVELLWVTGGVISLLVVATFLYWIAPAWKIWREKLKPLTVEDAPEVLAYLDELWRESELSRRPIFIWDPLNPNSGGVAFGRLNRYYVSLTGGLITKYYTDKPAFRAVVLVELAHLRNADTDKTHLTVAIWQAFIVATLVPFLFGSVISYVRGGEWRLLSDLSWRVLALAAFVYLVRNGVLRTREVYADVRASKTDEVVGALRAMLVALPQLSGNRLQKALNFHSDPKYRLRAIDETSRLFHMSFWDSFAAGVAAGIAFPNLELVLLWALPHALENYASNTAVLLFAPFAAGVVGLGAWRGIFADVAVGQTPRAIGRLGLGLGLGLILGYFFAFYTAIPAALTSNPTEQIIAFLFNALWMVVLLISLFLFFRWIAVSAVLWLEVAGTRRFLRRAMVFNLIVAGIVLVLWLGLLNELQLLGPLSLVLLFAPQYLIVSARSFLILMILWALPLSTWFFRAQASRDRDIRWAFLEPSSQALILPLQEPLYPGRALCIGLISGLVYCMLLVAYRIGLRLVLPEDVRSDDNFIMLFYYSQVALALIAQGVGAVVVTRSVNRLSGIYILFTAFITSCVMTLGFLAINLLFGGSITPSFTWTVFNEIATTGSALLALLVGSIWMLIQWIRDYQQMPARRARPLVRQILTRPDALYPAVYTLFVHMPEDAPLVLKRLEQGLGRAGERAGVSSIRALLAFSSGAELTERIQQIVVALQSDSSRFGAESLLRLYYLLAAALEVRQVPEIVALEFSRNVGRDPDVVTLQARGVAVGMLPQFLPQRIVNSLCAIERASTALRKYREVDSAGDKLGYLASALQEIEVAYDAVRLLRVPESEIITTIAERWRAAIAAEIDTVSGHAELRLDLRSRQIRRAPEVTLSLRLQNLSQSTAEDVVITLHTGDGFTVVGASEVTLPRVLSDNSPSIEYSIVPGEVESARIICTVNWNDRISRENVIHYADSVRFYTVAEEFQPIPNPYIVGHPVKSPNLFQGREDIFAFIKDNLGGPVYDRTLVLHGQRRTGKTSILYQLLNGRLGQNIVPVLIDMQELVLDINCTSDFLAEVAYEIARAVRKTGAAFETPAVEAFASAPTRTFSHFLNALEETLVGRRIIVMFDEFELIESKISEGKLNPDLLAYFRSLMQHRDGLIFLFTGTHRLDEMSQNYWSILFNIALTRRVSFLDKEDAIQLIRKPVAGVLDVDDLAVEKIINLTSGHAYFIQLICWSLVGLCNKRARNYATINDVNDAVSEILTNGGAYFAHIWQQADEQQRLALVGLAHTLRLGKEWVRPTDVMETLTSGGAMQLQQRLLTEVLDRLVVQEVLEMNNSGGLRYRFQIEILRLWIVRFESVTAMVERAQ
jgi:hypothetical protein